MAKRFHVIAGSLIVVCWASVWARQAEEPPTTLESQWTPADKESSHEKRIRSFSQHAAKIDAIRQEVERLGQHPWAGVYRCGDGRGYNVTVSIAPESGFFYTWRGCMGLYEWNHGTVRETERGTLAVELALSEDPDDPRRVGDEWAPVQWDGRQYLVAAHAMPGFCDSVNNRVDERWMFASGVSQHSPFFPMRAGHVPKAPDGEPVVPEAWRPLLRSSAVTGVVTKVVERREVIIGDEGQKAIDFVVEVDVGREDGVVEGMLMHADSGDSLYDSCRVTSVSEGSATVEVRAYLAAELAEGMKVSTHLRELPARHRK